MSRRRTGLALAAPGTLLILAGAMAPRALAQPAAAPAAPAAPAATTDEDAGDAYRRQGIEHLRRGAAALAISDLEAATEIDDWDGEALLALADAMVAIGRYAPSRRYYDLALRRGIDIDVTARLHLKAVALAALGGVSGAFSVLDAILGHEPDDVEALYLAGSLRARTGDPGGIPQIERALELDPQHADAATELGQAHLRHGDAEPALAALERADAIAPNRRPVVYAMIAALELLGRIGEAATQADRFRTLEPAWDGVDRERARLLRNPRDVPTYLRLARHLNRLEWREQAVGIAETALFLAPDSADALHQLGIALAALGRHPEAEVALRRAAALAPDRAEIHRDLYDCLQRIGAPDARRFYRRYRELAAADSAAATPRSGGEQRDP